MAYEPTLFEVNSTSFTNQSWVFGDGGVSLEESFEYTYTTPGTYTVELFLTNSNVTDCTLQIVETIVVSGNVGIDDNTVAGLRVFPNPAVNSASIEIPEFSALERLVVWSQAGKVVFEDVLSNESTYHLNVSNLNPGLYLLELFSPNGDVLREKLLVQR